MSGNRGRGGGGGSIAVNGKGSGGNNNGSGSGGAIVGSIPQASKKMVQSLKEIVNCPELEIYAMLKECNMDPNEAVNRLLFQDPFHKVKSKREKKKENKDATDSKFRGGSSIFNRGGRGGNDHYGRAILSQFASSESGALRAMPSYKGNGATYMSASSGPGVVGNSINMRPPSVSGTLMENKASSINTDEDGPSLHSSSVFQSPWSGAPGHMSMADIVKMGRPHGTGSGYVNPSQESFTHQNVIGSKYAPTPHELRSCQNYAAKVSEADVDLGVVGNQNVPPNDEWSQVEQPPSVSVPSISEPPAISEPYKGPSSLHFDGTNHHLDEFGYAEDAEVDSRHAKLQEESSGSASVLSHEVYININSYQDDQHVYEQQEVEDVGVPVSSVATNIQQLSLSKEEEEREEEEEDNEEEGDSSQEDSPAVKIPDHLQVQFADCSHLSFGSFGSGMSAPFGPFASNPPKSNVEEETSAADAPSVEHTDARNSDYYEDEHLQTASDGNTDQRLAVSSGSFEMPLASQSESLKQEAPELVAPGNEYSNPSSSSYTFENSQQLNPSSIHSQISSQMQNLPPFSGVMSYSNSLPSSLLPSNVHPVRDAELSYSPFPITQSMPTKYSSNVASNNGPPISMTEALKTGNFSNPQLTQNLPGSSISGGPAFPQHLSVHPYSQPSLPFGSMIGYSFLPQSYTYMPSAFQQAIAAAGNSTYHQSLSAAVLPQYKNSVPVGSLPQSATVPSGYGALGSSTNLPGNLSLNPPAAASAAAPSMSYDDVLTSQYKDAAHLLALQQGSGSRTMSAHPACTYYSFQGQQSQQPAGYRQSQQPSQHYGNLGGYPNFYHSQSGVPLEHQQQMSRDGSLGGSQGQQQPKQAQQIWQNSY